MSQQYLQLAGLEVTKNQWDHVDDFKWIKHDEPSPNWRVLPDAERSECVLRCSISVDVVQADVVAGSRS